MLYIRADANEIIGTGHVMRCLSIAQEMKKIDQDVTFLFADNRTGVILKQYSFCGICLETVWDNLDTEVEKMIEVIKEREVRFLLIDTYYVTLNYIEKIRSYTKIAYIDDLHTMLYPVDLLINYNMYAFSCEYERRYMEAKYQTSFFLGCDFVPLREEFQEVRKTIREIPNKILITSGGTDRYNVIGKLMCELKKQIWFSEFDYYVVIGRFNNRFLEISERYGQNSNIHILNNIPNISDYMRGCDIAITAGGVTTYELCACGIPSIIYIIADNQIEIANEVSKKGIIPCAGDVRIDINVCIKKIIDNVRLLKSDFLYRKTTSKKMQELVDGKGSRRLATILSHWIQKEKNEI